MHDLHATLLHMLGLDHEKLSVRFQGLNAGEPGQDHLGPASVAHVGMREHAAHESAPVGLGEFGVDPDGGG